MSIDLKLPFGEFLFACFEEYRQSLPGGRISPRLWQEKAELWHDQWHGFRKTPKKKREPKAPLSTVEQLYAKYPRHVAKAAALKAIERALTRTTLPILEEAVSAYAAITARWKKEDRAFIPHPATWFNEGRWEDDRTSWEREGMKPAPTPAAPPEVIPPEPLRWPLIIASLYPAHWLNQEERPWVKLPASTRTLILSLLETAQ